MTRLARTERAALCDTALEVGEDQPTLSGEWTVKDLVVHLLVREGSPASIGTVVSPLAGLTAAASRRLGRRPFPELVARLRSGPPRLSPFAIPKVDELANTAEYFIHHEDIRRARPAWTPRVLGDEAEQELWSIVARTGRLLTRKVPVGVQVEDSRTGANAVLRKAEPTAVLRGLPSELTLYLSGRSEHSRVELLGDGEAVARLEGTALGI
jgi:uncharacterized protein (TIGR03085 family)